MGTLKIVIVEDEEPGRDILKKYLQDEKGVELIAECENGFEGTKVINELKPDLVLLDVQMPKLNGFEMLEILDHKPEIIFTTAYDQYAIKAFEKNAVDYLMKPFSKKRFSEALKKVMERISKKTDTRNEYVKNLSNTWKEENLDRVVVKSNSKISVIPIEQIIYLEAQDDYVMIYTNEKKYLKQATMKYFEQNLDPKLFARIHRSYIIKLDQVTSIEPYAKDSYTAKLKNGASVRISKSGFKIIKQKLAF